MKFFTVYKCFHYEPIKYKIRKLSINNNCFVLNGYSLKHLQGYFTKKILVMKVYMVEQYLHLDSEHHI